MAFSSPSQMAGNCVFRNMKFN